MSHASLAHPFAPVFPTISPAGRHTLRAMARTLGFAMGCTAAAALMWLVLAGPGLVADHASTAVSRHMVR